MAASWPERLTIGILGLGLMGGSAAKALKAKTQHRVLVFDREPESLARALSEGSADGLLREPCGDNCPYEGALLRECHLLLVALYPQAAAEFITAFGSRLAPGAVVVDFCGVKRAVTKPFEQAAQRYGFHYIGGHPMAGLERSGFAYAQAGLFEGASMILTPKASLKEFWREPLEGFFTSLGFRGVKWSTPEEHDRIIAYTSQLAHVLSSAYVKSPTALTHQGFSAGSFQDMTRVAYLNETMWTELFFDNGDYLAAEIEGLAKRLLEYSRAIRQGRRQELQELLAEGRRCKELAEKGK